MDTWYKVTLSQDAVAAMKNHELTAVFGQIRMLHLSTEGAALFTPIATQFPMEFYFSPAAAKLAEHLIGTFSGQPCSAPKRSELAAVVADPDHLSKVPFAPED
jgi:hypothetical protein